MTSVAVGDSDAELRAPRPMPERRMSHTLERLAEGRRRSAVAVLLAVAAVAAWLVRFAQDDAFITYRFSRNLARGEGLVFNPGERVEGYTNFLYAVVHALPEWLGWNTPAFSQLYGIVLFLLALFVVVRVAESLFGSFGFGLLVGLVTTANLTFLGYATGGMETMQQTLLLWVTVWLLLPALRAGERIPLPALLGAGLTAGLAVLTRLDSVVFLAPLVLAAMWRQRSAAGGALRPPLRTMGAMALPAALVVLPWLVWKQGYYGELLPNTFFAKTGVSRTVPLLWALGFVVAFLLSYGAFLLIPRFLRLRKEFFAVAGVAALFVVVPVWVAYIFWAGSDFMEFRFMVVLIPALAMLAAFLLDRYVNALAQGCLVGVLLLFSLLHTVPVANNVPVMTFQSLEAWPAAGPTSWTGLGQDLGEWFPGGPSAPDQPVIAVGPIGVIGYYGDLETVDMFGLTDAWVARNAPHVPVYYPGHVRMAPVPYLLDRGVDLVVGFPGAITSEEAAANDSYRLSQLLLVYPSADLRELPPDAVVVELPAGPDHVWQTIYFGGNPVIDAAIEENGWAVKPIEPVCSSEDLADWLTRQASTRTCPT